MKKSGTQEINFTSDLSEALATASVVRERGVIEGVVILTGEKVSKNKTFYTKKALTEAVNRYEGAKMFLDHPKAGEEVRSVRDFGGTYKNVRIEEGKYLKADLHLVPNPSIRDIVMPIAESKPSLAGVGLSIRDRGHGREENGVFLVEGFAARGQYSIDLVTEASVNETLFESTQGGDEDMDKELLSKLTLEKLQEANPALVESITATGRQAALKEFEGQLKAGDDAGKVLAKARKMLSLAESGLPKEVIEKIKPVVEADTTTPEATEALIKAQKEILEAIKPTNGKGKEPIVRGNGASNENQLTEAELPSSDELARALQG
jgi:hypothetical protein